MSGAALRPIQPRMLVFSIFSVIFRLLECEEYGSDVNRILSEKDSWNLNLKKTLPKALRTQVLTALTSNFGLVALVQ